MLQFSGRGSAFADAHNAAFFIEDNDLILLDCPADAFQKVKKMQLSAIRNIYILVTHTHGDHSGGVGMMAQYAYFILQHPVTVVAPSEAVKEDLRLLLMQIEGCEEHWLHLTTAQELHQPWLLRAIPTRHAGTLKDKCLGWQIQTGGRRCIYTGDTATLSPYLPYLQRGDYLYTEASAYDSGVHLYLPDILPELIRLTQEGIHVFLMHLDNEAQISEMISGTEIQLAPLYMPDSDIE